jgi:predicted aldo/keto reductase-like oxidoreductase
MRLPRIVTGDKAQVDREKAYEMIRYAADHGVTYFDTAYGYHSGDSERVLGEALEEGGRRAKVKIATKQPFGVMKDLKSGGGKDLYDNARRNLEATLKKLRTDHIDMYLIHNIMPAAWEEIKASKVIELYEKFRSEGLIKGIGFSYHGGFDCFKDVLAFYDWGMCQIQQNFVDIDNQATQEGIHLAGKKGCALVIMEPIRGGNLANPSGTVRAIYDEYNAKKGISRKPVEWAFRHIVNYPEVSLVLSGVSTLEQLKEDIDIFSKPDMKPGCLSEEEKQVLTRVREAYKAFKGIPCTGCEYCMPCPNGVDIPGLFSLYNEAQSFNAIDPAKREYMFHTHAGNDASHCKDCHICEAKCPQHIKIPEQLKMLHEKLKGWLE